MRKENDPYSLAFRLIEKVKAWLESAGVGLPRLIYSNSMSQIPARRHSQKTKITISFLSVQCTIYSYYLYVQKVGRALLQACNSYSTPTTMRIRSWGTKRNVLIKRGYPFYRAVKQHTHIIAAQHSQHYCASMALRWSDASRRVSGVFQQRQ